MRANHPNSSLLIKLDRAKQLNCDLRRLLMEGSEAVATDRGKSSNIISLLHRDIQQPEELYKALCRCYACDCDEPHITNLTCHCESCRMPFVRASRKSDDVSFKFCLLLGEKIQAEEEMETLQLCESISSTTLSPSTTNDDSDERLILVPFFIRAVRLLTNISLAGSLGRRQGLRRSHQTRLSPTRGRRT